MIRAIAAMLPDGRRLHLQHGPIDLIIGAEGASREVARAYQVAQACFEPVLQTLVAELPMLRNPVTGSMASFDGPVAQRMGRAVASHGKLRFVTPMAAVAGAVADEVLDAMTATASLEKAYVNNGGDAALFLAEGQRFTVAMAANGGRAEINAADRIGGVATSGWRGRSWSFGIADAVTVLARNAAEADVTATLIANAVDLPGHPAVRRQPACVLDPDSDLGERQVTVGVNTLTDDEIARALYAGVTEAERLTQTSGILGAALSLCGVHRLTGAASPFSLAQATAPGSTIGDAYEAARLGPS